MNSARLVIIGAGIVGCSAAYHLTQRGWRDIVILDQGPLFHTGGSTSHAPGLVFQTNPSKTMTELAKQTVALYSHLSLDGAPCFYPVGSMEVARTRARWEELKRRLEFGMSWGLRGELLSSDEARRRLPLLDPSKIRGALYVHDDGIAKAVRAAEAMSRDAGARGAEFRGVTEVTGIEVARGSVRAVVTSAGRIAADQVLVCAGIWGPRVGHMAGVPIPLSPCQHLYAATAPIPELAGETGEAVHPILRDQDRSMYFRQHADGYGIGSYRHEPLMLDPGAVPAYGTASTSPAVMPFTPEHFKTACAAAVELLPVLRGAALTSAINGVFSFTPDGFPLIGEAAGVQGLWIAEAVWITHAGGVGKAVAEWMADGTPAIDLRECDVNRFPPHGTTATYVRTRAAQQYREVYDIVHPLQQTGPPRNLRVSPFHRRLEALGAVFSETAGWERPLWFQANEGRADWTGLPARTGWESVGWSPIQAIEHRAARTGAAMMDLTAFTKIEVTGPDALSFLDRLCANRIDRPTGAIVYTPLLNERGGIMCDLTVTRLGDDRFFIVTGGASGMHDLAWIRRHLEPSVAAEVTDVTSTYCCVGLWGPKARVVLAAVCAADLSSAAFPYLTARSVDIGGIPSMALRVSYVGELGWEIYTRAEYGLRLWDLLWEAGKSHDVAAVGTGAFDSLRLEKGYRLWGADVHSDYNPYEAGLAFAVKLDKGHFLGRNALLNARTQLTRKLCCLTLDEPVAVVIGKEPILDGNTVLGYVTSANYGYTVGALIAYGYLPRTHTAPGTAVEIEYFGRRHRARVTREPLYDPQGTKLRV